MTTLSSAMDVSAPSSWERVRGLFGNRLDAMRSALRAGRCTDAETRKSMWELHASGYLPEPHSAVAHWVLQERLGLSETGVLLATAHPAKSAELLRERMNLSFEPPAALAGLRNGPTQAKPLAADFEALKMALLH